jgi:regulatory protein
VREKESMKKITAIQAQRKDPNRVNIYLDGEFAFGLARITAAWLQVGQTLDEAKIAQLLEEDARERALRQALLYLSYRPRSEAEIRQNLRKHAIPEAVIEDTLDKLRQERFADDSQFARAWVENRAAFRPRARRLLALELRQKGLTDEVIHSALQGVDDEALAYEAASKTARRLRVQERSVFRKKLSDFLVRRGFSYSVVTAVVERLWQEICPQGELHSMDNEETS